MAFFNTDLRIFSAPLPFDFEGTPQDLFTAMIERMSIKSPSGVATFVTGDTMPSSNVGPWLKGGTQWWVFDVTTGTYIPLDISESERQPFFIGPANPGTPGPTDPLVWLQTSENRAVAWRAWNGTVWRAFGTPASGTTAERPGVPVDLETYFDTTINVLIHWERGAWRTVSGSPGDVKAVTGTLLAGALAANPGWGVLGETDMTLRGRVIGEAAKDPGASPVASYPTSSGITQRSAGELAGEETHVITSDEIESHTHLMGHASALNSNDIGQFHRVDDAVVIAIPAPIPPNYFEINGTGGNGSVTGTAGNGPAGTALITSRQLTLATVPSMTSAATAHNNLPQTLFLWHLVKA